MQTDGRAERADGLVARAAESAAAEWLAARTVDDALVGGRVLMPRWLAEQTQERLRPYRLGVQVRDASARLFPPDEVKDAFDNVTRSQTAIRTAVNEAEQEAEKRLRVAESDRYRMQQQAAAYAREKRLMAKAEADSFAKRLAQYRELRQKNPDVLGGIWWAEMGKLFARMKANGQIDLLDHHLGADGLDLTVFPPSPRK